MTVLEIANLIIDVPNFPKPGIIFKDITPVLESGKAFKSLIRHLSESAESWRPDKIVAIESRGFILGSAMAQELGCGLVLVRKSGKLPRASLKAAYSLEYGNDSVEMHADAIGPGERAVIVDDVLATGGTLKAALELCTKAQASICGAQVFLELGFLNGRNLLKSMEIRNLVKI